MRKAQNDKRISLVSLFFLSLVVVAPFAANRLDYSASACGPSSLGSSGCVKDKALGFLEGLYNNSTGLASEYNGSKTYWIYDDNALLFQILNIFGRNETCDKIGRTIDNYSKDYGKGNDRIEVLFNRLISHPPYTSTGYYYSPIVNDTMQLGTNQVYNPSAENGTLSPDGWFASDPNLTKTPWTTERHRSGQKSLGLNVTSENADWRSRTFPVEPLKNYLVRCYVEGQIVGGDWFVYLRWFNSSQQWIGENFTQISPGNYPDWTQLMLFNFTCPAGASSADIRFLTKNGTGELYADDFEAEKIIDSGTFIIRNDRKYMQIPDWQSYADLFMYGIIDESFNDRTKAVNDFTTLVNTMCKQEGVNDGKSGGEYQTYKVALVLICSKILNHSIAYLHNYTQILCQMQVPDGGFRTGYLQGIILDPNATENVETTCLALYALNEPPQPWIPEFPDAIIFRICMSIPLVIVLISKKVMKRAFSGSVA